MKKSELRQLIREEISKVLKENDQTINLTPQQKKEFIERIEYLIDEEGQDYAMREAGNILTRVLTQDEAEFIEDVEDFGYDAEAVENYAQDLVGNTDFQDLKDIEVKNIEIEIQNYIKRGSKGDLFLNKYKGKTLPSNFPKVERNLVLNNSSITFLPKDLSVGGTLFLYNTPIAKKYNEEELKNMLPGVNNFYI